MQHTWLHIFIISPNITKNTYTVSGAIHIYQKKCHCIVLQNK
ncbi:MAG: hypothetical protein BWY22_01297 [Bacteroidetes bacterium ADurb.Bin217]|nr:MAG: hypothetical protein BWY22_01297 [Bacteroidetes bacterium ADurb.Bin217]